MDGLRPAQHRAGLVVAGDDLALRIDHCDPAPASGPVRPPGVGGIVGEGHQFGPLARAIEDGVLDVLHLADAVDQAEALGLRGRVGARFHRLLQCGWVLAPVLGGGLDRGLIDRAHPRQGRLPVGGGVVAVEVGIDGVLVLVALLVVGLDAILVEQALEEHVLGGHAHRLEGRPGLHPELVGGGAQHIGRGHRAGRRQSLAVGVDRLARGTEVLDRQPQLIGLPRRQAAFGQADQDALHVRVGLGVAQARDDRHGRQRAPPEGREGRLGVLIVDRVS